MNFHIGPPNPGIKKYLPSGRALVFAGTLAGAALAGTCARDAKGQSTIPALQSIDGVVTQALSAKNNQIANNADNQLASNTDANQVYAPLIIEPIPVREADNAIEKHYSQKDNKDLAIIVLGTIVLGLGMGYLQRKIDGPGSEKIAKGMEQAETEVNKYFGSQLW